MLHHRPASSSVPRRRLLALLLGATGLIVLLTVGLALSVAALAHPAGHQDPRPSAPQIVLDNAPRP